MAKPQGDIETCNRCGADIVWIDTFKGKRMPLDASSYEAGDQIYDRNKHTSHFDTCTGKDSPAQQSGARSGQAPAKSGGLLLEPEVEKAMIELIERVTKHEDFDAEWQNLREQVEVAYGPPKQAENEFEDDIPF